MDDPLDALVARLEELEETPLGEHPAVLDDVHAALVAELEALASGTRVPAPGGPAPGH